MPLRASRSRKGSSSPHRPIDGKPVLTHTVFMPRRLAVTRLWVSRPERNGGDSAVPGVASERPSGLVWGESADFPRHIRHFYAIEAGEGENRLGVVAGVRKDYLAPGQCLEGRAKRRVEGGSSPEGPGSGGSRAENALVGAVVANEAEEGGAIAYPVLLADARGFVGIDPRWRSMYSRIERLMWGKMWGVASWRVLSRSRSQTGWPVVINGT